MNMTILISRLLELAISIQQIPAPTFLEARRAEFVLACFARENLSDLEIDGSGNVYARLPGKGNHIKPDKRAEKSLVISAHMDTVFPTSVDLRLERETENGAENGKLTRLHGPGIGDNSLGVAALFGLLWLLRERSLVLPGDLWLVANVGEEGLGDLIGMKALVNRLNQGGFKPETGVTLTLDGKRNNPLAYIVLEGLALGQIYHRGLRVRRYRIKISTAGGHSWIDYGRPSAIHELTALSTRIAAIETPRLPRTTLNIGIISGGSSVNSIAAEAMLELDLRSESAEALETLAGQVIQLVKAAVKPGVKVKTEVIGERPFGEIPTGHPLVVLAQDSLREVGIEPHLNTGSTDANLPLSLGLPSITIGLTNGGRAHTVHEFINFPPLEKGLEQLVRLVTRVWEKL
jgi:tripeptide aminopeptidase